MRVQTKLPSIRVDVAELLLLFGPPALLPSEDLEAYAKLIAGLLDSFVCPDFMVQLLIKEVADSTQEASRLARHKIILMQRRFADPCKYQALRAKATAEGNTPAEGNRSADGKDTANGKGGSNAEDGAASAPIGGNGNPSGEPDEVLEGLVEEIDAMVLGSVAEREQMRALEVGIRYYEHLDQLQLNALARRDKALAQIERWVEGLGQALREFSDEIMTANLTKALSDGTLSDGALSDGTAANAPSIAANGEQAA